MLCLAFIKLHLISERSINALIVVRFSPQVIVAQQARPNKRQNMFRAKRCPREHWLVVVFVLFAFVACGSRGQVIARRFLVVFAATAVRLCLAMAIALDQSYGCLLKRLRRNRLFKVRLVFG